MHAICIDAWNQAGIDEVSMTCRSAATGQERNDATIKMAVYPTSAFEPGILKREMNSSRITREASPTLRSQMGDNQTSVIAFAQNAREEIRKVNGDGSVTGALAANSGTHQTNYISKTTQNQHNMKAEVRRLTPTEVQRLQGFDDGHLDVNNQGDSAKYSETGNSWAVPNARHILKGIHKVDAKLNGGKHRPFKYGTISSGVEAHTQASAGFGDKAVFFSEIAPSPCGVLATHYPDVPNLGDMTLVDFDKDKKCIHNRPYDGYSPIDKSVLGFDPYKTEKPVEIPCEFGDVDVVSGGTPCQDLSVAGKRRGAEEGSNTRSSLAFQLPRIGAAVGAKYIVWENVAGAFSSNGGRDFSWLLHRMTEYGYTALAWRCMDAQFIRTDKHPRGVPQRRRRVWIVGYRGSDWRVPCEAIFEPMKVLGSEPPKRTTGVGFLKKTVANVSEGDKRTELEEFNEFINGANPIILDTLISKRVCESIDDRIRELQQSAAKNGDGDTDLFGGDLFGDFDSADVHQGRGITESDLDLGMPNEDYIRSIPQYKLFQWASSICSEVNYFGEMFKPHDGAATVDDLNPKMLENIGNAGFLCNGLICTMKMPEWNAGVTKEELTSMPLELAELYDGDVCGLSDILEDNPDPKYKLSWRACYGILRRALARGKKLPIELGYALVERIIEQAGLVKWTGIHGKDTVKKEGDASEREIARTAFTEYIESTVKWDAVSEVQPSKCDSTGEEDSEDGNDEPGEEE